MRAIRSWMGGCCATVGLLVGFACSPAHAQLTLTLTNPSQSASQSTVGVVFAGTLANNTGEAVDLSSLDFNVFTGPDTTKLSLDSYFGPMTLGNGLSYNGNLFSLDVDSAAPVGTYTGLFDVVYTGETTSTVYQAPASNGFPSANFTLTVTAAPVPEASGSVLFCVPLALLGASMALRAYRPRAGAV